MSSSYLNPAEQERVGMATKQPLSKKDYYRYIVSAEWSLVKQRYLASKLPKDCYCCGKLHGTYRVEFHHRTYKRLGCERLLDIVPVCRDCHQGVHDLNKSGRFTLWKATNKAKKKKA